MPIRTRDLLASFWMVANLECRIRNRSLARLDGSSETLIAEEEALQISLCRRLSIRDFIQLVIIMLRVKSKLGELFKNSLLEPPSQGRL